MPKIVLSIKFEVLSFFIKLRNLEVISHFLLNTLTLKTLNIWVLGLI